MDAEQLGEHPGIAGMDSEVDDALQHSWIGVLLPNGEDNIWVVLCPSPKLEASAGICLGGVGGLLLD